MNSDENDFDYDYDYTYDYDDDRDYEDETPPMQGEGAKKEDDKDRRSPREKKKKQGEEEKPKKKKKMMKEDQEVAQHQQPPRSIPAQQWTLRQMFLALGRAAESNTAVMAALQGEVRGLKEQVCEIQDLLSQLPKPPSAPETPAAVTPTAEAHSPRSALCGVIKQNGVACRKHVAVSHMHQHLCLSGCHKDLTPTQAEKVATEWEKRNGKKEKKKGKVKKGAEVR
eukprot:TRINITY_DN7702_c0_g1_i2.p1 TRINITY_DN7702_c0_g1~~TRINITY_DN7702_c0_g1_i2.p1  ORF type:complete len:225 (+),score=35.47 TRINITY_DN7702_c0_g1_i2:43-717(+)